MYSSDSELLPEFDPQALLNFLIKNKHQIQTLAGSIQSQILIAPPFSYEPDNQLVFVVESLKTLNFEKYELFCDRLRNICAPVEKEVTIEIHSKKALDEVIEKQDALSKYWQLMLDSAFRIENLNPEKPLTEQWSLEKTNCKTKAELSQGLEKVSLSSSKRQKSR